VSRRRNSRQETRIRFERRRVSVPLSAFVWLCMLCLLGSCSRQPAGSAPVVKPPARFDHSAVNGDRAMSEVKNFIALGSRDAGTDGALRAVHYLEKRLREIGVETEVDEFEDTTPQGIKTFRNVIGRIPGDGAGLIILGSHYDTKAGIAKDFMGANDSGSSSGLLLELARVFHNGPTAGPDILVVFFDGEECAEKYGRQDGLHGSRHMAHRLVDEGLAGSVRAVIILDMIGDRDLTVTVPRNSSSEMCSIVLKAARNEGAREKFSLAGPIIDDHVPFIQAGMPTVDLIDFEYGSAPGLNDYWHTTADTADKLSPESLATVGKVAVRTVNAVLVRHEGD
jgi:glutaminyl-peptide cyclotransferase